jgi:hypothetical protein
MASPKVHYPRLDSIRDYVAIPFRVADSIHAFGVIKTR